MASTHFEFNKEDVSEIVLMPGDPLRAKYIADTYLSDVKLINSVRNNLGFTGYYKGKRLSVIASGMGIPSMGIYAYELFHDYNVKSIIRLGTCGSMRKDIKVKDVIVASSAYSLSSFAYLYSGNTNKEYKASELINNKIKEVASNNIIIREGLVFSTDVFEPNAKDNIVKNLLPKERGFIAAEMESFALFYLANYLNKEAACVLTVSDSPFEEYSLSKQERQESLDQMITLVLETTLLL